ncbi:restriction endonuclease [Brevibacillus borstelensis AK1]|uniref:Restriction endonuclease n=1 Tax=Brevibacillus borstelensis AK1 TaxID=1300222 RepID=M8EFM8_9BACL|nr:restriction endonuclease [Brevibacillus borstelensis]EMT54285.1 restriction endonuclease [Brevibacillus borstelensis AK1]
MGRGFVSTLNKIAREAAKAQRNAERRQRAIQREYERKERLQRQYERQLEREREKSIKQAIRDQKNYEKEQKVRYLESRKEETKDLNDEVQYILEDFQSVLMHTLNTDDTISFDSLYPKDTFPDFVPPTPSMLPINQLPVKDDFFMGVQQEPPLLEKIFGIGKEKRLESIKKAEAAYAAAIAEFDRVNSVIDEIRKEDDRRLQEAKEQYDKEKQAFQDEVTQRIQQVNLFKSNYYAGEKDAVEAYNVMVLERSEYSDLFPQQFELYYVEQSKELVVEYELPSLSAIPEYKEYKYIQSKDEIKGTEFKAKEKSEIYSNLIASVTLRTLHELFEADQANVIDSIVFNGVVNTVNPSTGLSIRPCVVTVQTTKSEFNQFDLSKVDVIACVKGLKAQISPSLTELAPVKPIVNLDMLDSRFIDERDMISGIDDRTNLLEMDPFDFEHLVCNLFSKIGLESKLTRSSRDGGVDVIAFDPRPVFGGKYVIQAKRYRNTVEVAAVRDLYGTMMNENAAKGILVTTSTFGPEARGFAKDKPIELIDGANLLYLLEQHGIRAKIEIPQ